MIGSRSQSVKETQADTTSGVRVARKSNERASDLGNLITVTVLAAAELLSWQCLFVCLCRSISCVSILNR